MNPCLTAKTPRRGEEIDLGERDEKPMARESSRVWRLFSSRGRLVERRHARLDSDEILLVRSCDRPHEPDQIRGSALRCGFDMFCIR